VIALYIALGGMYSVVWTDALQGIVMAAGVLLFAFYTLKEVGGLYTGLNRLYKIDPALSSLPGRNIGWGELVDLVTVTSIAVWGLPQLINRFYTARDPSIVRRSTWFAVFLAIAITFSAYLGGALGNIVNADAGLALDPLKDIGRAVPVLASRILSPGFLAIFSAAVLAAAMSTMDSVALTSSSAVLYDLLNVKNTKVLRVGSALYTLSVAALAVPIASLGLTSIFKIGWLIVSGALLVPILTGLIGLKDPASSIISSVAGGASATILSLVGIIGKPVGYVFPLSQSIALAAFATTWIARKRAVKHVLRARGET